MVTERRRIDNLRPHPRNYRQHPEEQVQQIAASLRDLGQYRPIVITADGTILAGHGVVEAARSLGWEEVECVVFEGSEVQHARLLVADNELARMATDDDRALADLLAELAQQNELEGTGWTLEEVNGLIANLAAYSEDEITIVDGAGADESRGSQRADLGRTGYRLVALGDLAVISLPTDIVTRACNALCARYDAEPEPALEKHIEELASWSE